MLSLSAMSRPAPGEVAPPRSLERQRLEVDRQLSERARVADEPGLSLVDRDRVVVPHRGSHAADLPAPPHDVLDRQLQDVVRRALEDGHRGRVSVGDQQGEALEHQVEWMRVRRQRRERAHRTADLEKDVRSAEVAAP